MYERKVKIDKTITDSYKSYKKESKNTITKSRYNGICYKFNKKVSDKIIKESFEFKVPFGLGYLRIKANKVKLRVKDGKLLTHKMAIDWKATWVLWSRLYPNKTRKEIIEIPDKKLVVHVNEHSDGYIMRWYWDKRLSSVKNQTVYKFKPVKGGLTNDGYYSGRLGLAKWIKDPDRVNEYYM